MTEKWVTLQQAAVALGVSESSIRRRRTSIQARKQTTPDQDGYHRNAKRRHPGARQRQHDAEQRRCDGGT